MSVGDPSAHNASGEAGPPADAFAEEVPQADQQPRPPKKERKVYQQIQIPSPEQMMQEEFMNNCATRTVLSGVMGMGLGVLFGIVMGSMDSAGVGMEGSMAAGAETQTIRQAATQMLRTVRSRSWSYAKGFGFMGAVFAGSECVIEKTRAQHDIYNSVYAGCVTGGALAYRAGPAAMCGGCATFAAFSALIDKVMEHD